MTMRWLAMVAVLWSASAMAQSQAVQIGETCDPCVPPSLRKALPVERNATQGAALRDEVEQRLRAPFEAAARDGMLTREQANAAGLGFIVRHFDAMDRSGQGAIRFEDYKRFLRERGAALN